MFQIKYQPTSINAKLHKPVSTSIQQPVFWGTLLLFLTHTSIPQCRVWLKVNQSKTNKKPLHWTKFLRAKVWKRNLHSELQPGKKWNFRKDFLILPHDISIFLIHISWFFLSVFSFSFSQKSVIYLMAASVLVEIFILLIYLTMDHQSIFTFKPFLGFLEVLLDKFSNFS